MGSPSEHVFRAVLLEARGGGRVVEVPLDTRTVFGEARPPVEGTINGLPLRSRLAVYGGRTYLGLGKDVRAAAGIEVGDVVEVVLRRDERERKIDVPAELEKAFDEAPDAREAFDGLAFTHRREYTQWIADARRAGTKLARVERAVTMLRDGVKHP
jgi:hypothetical protein